MGKTIKISFDFDMTLGERHIQELASLLILAGADVWILTARVDDYIRDENKKIIGYNGYNHDLRQVARRLGIPKDKILFTGGARKVKMYQEHKFDMHFDDMWDEVEAINRVGGKAMLVDMRIGDIIHLMNCENLNIYFEE